MRLLLLAVVALVATACGDVKSPTDPCVVEARAEYQIYDHDYFRANDVYQKCLRRRASGL